MFHMISNLDPYESLSRDIYSADIFSESTNSQLALVDKDEKNKVITIEKQGGSQKIKKYLLVKCLDFLCESEDVEGFLIYLQGNIRISLEGYNKISPVLVAPGFCGRALESVEKYNKTASHPIVLYKYGA